MPCKSSKFALVFADMFSGCNLFLGRLVYALIVVLSWTVVDNFYSAPERPPYILRYYCHSKLLLEMSLWTYMYVLGYIFKNLFWLVWFLSNYDWSILTWIWMSWHLRDYNWVEALLFSVNPWSWNGLNKAYAWSNLVTFDVKTLFLAFRDIGHDQFFMLGTVNKIVSKGQ